MANVTFIKSILYENLFISKYDYSDNCIVDKQTKNTINWCIDKIIYDVIDNTTIINLLN
jgi:hypothetical protein